MEKINLVNLFLFVVTEKTLFINIQNGIIGMKINATVLHPETILKLVSFLTNSHVW